MDAKTGANTKTASLNIGNESWSFPIYEGTVGPEVVDISKLYNLSGRFTYDPGFTSTGSCESKITYIDGDEGVLLYRGYPIEQLAAHGDFLETCYLLLYGELPTAAQKADFDYRVTRHTMVHEQMNRFFQGFRRDAHPMAIMVGCVGALSAFYHDSTDISDPMQRMIASIRMIAKMPTLAAMAYKYSVGQPFMYPKNDLDYSSNFLRMCFAVPCEEYKVNPVLARAMDRIFILHADHEQNASTSTVRVAGSSGANPFGCIAAGIACLWGPAHGGANEAALKMLGEIGRVERIPEFIKRSKDKNDPFRLMGFGHRVYKHYDPRAKIMQKTCYEVLNETGHKDDPMLEVALELERIALNDDYFIEKKLYPNVDFYSGITLKAMGFPTTMFTVLFALARTVGWIAQWKEMIEDPNQKIGRRASPNTAPPGPIPCRSRGANSALSKVSRWLCGSRIRQCCRAPSPDQTEHHVGGLGARLRRQAHDFIETRESLDLTAPLRRVGEQRTERIGKRRRRAVALQKLRHDFVAEHEVRQDHAVDGGLQPHDRPRQRHLERADAVGPDHRHARKRKLERHGSRCGERGARLAESSALFFRVDHDARPRRPTRRRLMQPRVERRHGGHDQFERAASLLRQPHRAGERLDQAADFA